MKITSLFTSEPSYGAEPPRFQEKPDSRTENKFNRARHRDSYKNFSKIKAAISLLCLPAANAVLTSQVQFVSVVVPMWDARLGRDYGWCFSDPYFASLAANVCIEQAKAHGGTCDYVYSSGHSRPLPGNALELNFMTQQTWDE